MGKAPSTTASNGRTRGGRFAPGNRFAKGNPYAAKVAKLRAELLRTVSPADMRAVARGLIRQAKAGDVMAARLLLDRTLGPAEALDVLKEVQALRERLEGVEHGFSSADQCACC